MDKINLVRRISDLLGDLVIEGTTDLAEADAILDPQLVYELADQPRGQYLYIHTSPTGNLSADQSRIIASFNTASYAAIVTPTFSVIPTIGDQYFIFEKNKWDLYSRLVDIAIQNAGRIFHKPMMATMSIVGTQYEYGVPSGFKYINRLMVVPSGSDLYTLDNRFEVPRKGWTAKVNPEGSYAIFFDRRYIDLAGYNGEAVQVQGIRSLGTLATPTTNWEGPEDYVINHTLMHLANRNIDKGEGWLNRYYAYRREVDKLEQHYTRIPADSVRVDY